MGRPPIEEIVVILDATDPWNEVQRAVIMQEFRALQHEIPRFARVSLYTLTSASSELPAPALQLCNPGNVADLSRSIPLGRPGVRLVATPQMVELRWRDGFIARLDSIFEAQGASAGTRRSPIMETIRSAAISVFGAAPRDTAPPRKLYIFSDMLQHTDRYSHYADTAWTAADAQLLADLSAMGTTALLGAEVHLFLLDRDFVGRGPGNSRSALLEFWHTYFAAQGATLLRVRRIEG